MSDSINSQNPAEQEKDEYAVLRKQYYDKYLAAPKMKSLEMRNLIFEALAEEDPEKTPRNHTFKENGYKGCITDLRLIVEYKAIKNNLIEECVIFSNGAWGCPGEIPHFMDNTNFNKAEQNMFLEEFYCLLFQNVISPGGADGAGMELPFFHVSAYGLKCIKQKDILPYDAEGFLKKIKNAGSDMWEEYYVEEALKCFNCGAYSASLMMIGLCGEYIAERLIEAMSAFLQSKEPVEYANFDNAIKQARKISKKYTEFENELLAMMIKKDANKNLIYPSLNAFQSKFDTNARSTYATFLRLTRNELMHPNDLKKDRLECLMIFISFVKYFQTQKACYNELVNLK